MSTAELLSKAKLGLHHWPRLAARISGPAAATIGLLGLLGWVTGTAALASVIPGRPAMQPNTAVALIVLGIAQSLLVDRPVGRARRIVAHALAVSVLLVGTMTLVQYATGLDLHVDRPLLRVFASPGPPPAGAGIPGRPALATAVGFVLLSLALLGLDARPRRGIHPAEILGAVAGLVMHAVVTGHVYGAELIYSARGYPATGTALHTAVAQVCLAFGIATARPDRGLMATILSERAGGSIARRLLVPAIAGPPLLGLVVELADRWGWIPGPPFSYAVLATASAAIAALLVLRTAASLNVADAVRVAYEKELRRYERVVESSDDAIIAKTPEGTITAWNPAAERMYGWRASEIVGRGIEAIVPEDRRAELAGTVETLRRGGRVQLLETVRLRKDGARLEVSLSMSPIRDAAGRLVGVSSIARDISERKAAEAALARAHEAERRLREQLEKIGSATAMISDAVASIPESDLSAVLHTVVLQAQSLTGARYGALGIGGDATRPFDRWVYAGMSAEEAAEIGRHPRPVGVLGEAASRVESTRLRDVSEAPGRVGFPSGHPAMRSFLGVPVLYRGHSVGTLYLAEKQGAHEFSEDDQRAVEILASRVGAAVETARLYGEEALAKAWLQGVFDGMPEGVLLADASGHVTYNAAALRLARHDVADTDASGAPLRLDVRDPSGRPLGWTELPIARALLEGALVAGEELWIRNGDGGVVPVLASAAPLRDQAHATVGAVCVLRDITPLKALEQLREEWTAVVAHDLRQPLNVISLSAQTLHRTDACRADEAAARSVERIRSAAGRLDRMVRDLLDASKIEAHELSLERRRTDLARLLSEVVERTAEAASPRHVELRVVGELPELLVDADRIEQLVDNLLSNALKYGTPGTDVVVEASTNEDRVLVCVENCGQTLTDDEIARLFTRFYRAPSSRSSAAGSGLGLYIAKGLVEAHGGRIWAQTSRGRTTFSFTLPLRDTAGAVRRTGS